MKPTYTVAELCERYRVEEHTVLRWIKAGELKALDVRRNPRAKRPTWRITPEALSEFEAARESRRSPERKTKKKARLPAVKEFLK